MRVESMVAQQALLAPTTRNGVRGSRAERGAQRPAEPPSTHTSGTRLPSAIADRLAAFFAADPGFAEAVSAQMPAARRTSARDLAAYGRGPQPRQLPQLIDTSG